MDFLKLFGKSEKKSKNVAKERLKLVLINDRSNFSPRFLEMIRGDILRAVSEYIEVNEAEFDLKITKTRSSSDDKTVSSLVVTMPISKIKEKYKE